MKIIKKQDVHTNPAKLFIGKRFMCSNCRSELEFEPSDFEGEDFGIVNSAGPLARYTCPNCRDESVIGANNVYGSDSCLWH